MFIYAISAFYVFKQKNEELDIRWRSGRVFRRFWVEFMLAQPVRVLVVFFSPSRKITG
jgi:hypothetical protein